MIKLSNVSKYYYNKGIIAVGLNNVSLELNIGEFVAITGESGSGKSTLLNVISGLDTYEEGEMYILGNETSHYSTEDFEKYRKEYIGNIFQSFHLVTSYTVYQNIELVLLLNGYDKKKIKPRVEELIKLVNLQEYRNTKASKLSGGQKQRVAIARALAKETPIIIADEPTGNLDVKSANEVMEVLSKISKERLVVIVTHNYEQVEPYITRSIVMHDGRVLEDRIINSDQPILQPNKQESKKMRLFSQIRLGIRNTFNVLPKFILLLLVFAFTSLSVCGEYAVLQKEFDLQDQGGYVYGFEDNSRNRMIVTKKGLVPFIEEDYESLKNNALVKEVVKSDWMADCRFEFADVNDTFWEWSLADYVSHLESEVVEGRLPENENEILIEKGKQYWNAFEIGQQINISSMNKTVTLVGIAVNQKESYLCKLYVTENFFDGYNPYESHLSPYLVCDHERYFITKIKSLDYIIEDMGLTIVPASFVKDGELYVCDSLSYLLNKPFSLDIENSIQPIRYPLKATKVINKSNFKTITGVNYSDKYANVMFISQNDYNKVFSNENYQVSIYATSKDVVEELKQELESQGYECILMKDIIVQDGSASILRIIKTFITMCVLVVLFFIVYFVVKIIMKSRNVYYSIVRMLGGTRKVARNILIYELLIVGNIAYGLTALLAYFASTGMKLPSIFFNMANYLSILSIQNWIVFYFIIIGMIVLIGLRFSKQLFKQSAITTLNEEV